MKRVAMNLETWRNGFISQFVKAKYYFWAENYLS